MNMTKECRESLVAGAHNQGTNSAVMGMYAEGPCTEPQTHTLRGKGLCEKHWRQALNNNRRTDQRMNGYRSALANYLH